MDISKYYNYYEPIIEALKKLGGSGTNEEIVNEVISIAFISDEDSEKLHSNGPRTVVNYQIAWAKTYLKHAGYIENSKRGIWSLTDKGLNQEPESHEVINKLARKKSQSRNLRKKKGKSPDIEDSDIDSDIDSEEAWIDELNTILKGLSPEGFERLCQEVLRENGFIKVKVTDRVSDGGIDGVGILKVGLVTFRTFFQCKRYEGSVGSPEIQKFRGAIGQTDKGIFLTTGHFTKSASEEAAKTGFSQIELIDGRELCWLLKKSELGVKVEMRENVTINDEWFNKFRP